MHTRPNRTGRPPLLFLDLETGGLDALQHEILELGAVLTSPDGSAELGRIGRVAWETIRTLGL